MAARHVSENALYKKKNIHRNANYIKIIPQFFSRVKKDPKSVLNGKKI